MNTLRKCWFLGIICLVTAAGYHTFSGSINAVYILASIILIMYTLSWMAEWYCVRCKRKGTGYKR